MSCFDSKCPRCGDEMDKEPIASLSSLKHDWCPRCHIQIVREEDGRSSCWDDNEFMGAFDGWLVAGAKDELKQGTEEATHR